MKKTVKRKDEPSGKPPSRYSPPQIDDLGELRSMTLGGSPGEFESGNEATNFP